MAPGRRFAALRLDRCSRFRDRHDAARVQRRTRWTMKRREFVTAVLASVVAIEALAAQGHNHNKEFDGPLANATVSFGAWPTEPAFDRFAPPPPGPPPNVHELFPYTTTIKAGGSV